MSAATLISVRLKLTLKGYLEKLTDKANRTKAARWPASTLPQAVPLGVRLEHRPLVQDVDVISIGILASYRDSPLGRQRKSRW